MAFFFQEEETSFHTLLTKSHRELKIVSIDIDIDIYVYTYTYIYMYLLLYNLRHTLEMFVLTWFKLTDTFTNSFYMKDVIEL